MRVLYITNNYPTQTLPIFGIFVKEQMDSVAALGEDCDLYFINGRELGKWEYLKTPLRLRKYLKNNQYDVVHCHHSLSALCLIFSMRFRKVKCIVSFQNDPLVEAGRLFFKLIRRCFDGMIIKNTNTQVTDKYEYLPNGVNLDFFKPINRSEACKAIGLDQNKQYILFVSSNFVRKQKRQDRFEEVIYLLKTRYGRDNIEFLQMTNVKRELVPFYFNASALHLLTSDFEGSPNSVKESLACNVPVVSTPVGNVRQLLKGVNGSKVASTFEPTELAKLVDEALDYSGDINARKKIIEKKLDLNSVAICLRNIYLELTTK